MKIVEYTFNDEDELKEFAISLVIRPAIKENFIKLSDEEQAKKAKVKNLLNDGEQ